MAALRSPHSIRRFAPAIVLVGAALALSGCGAPTFGAFRGRPPRASDEFKLWVGMVIAGLVVAVLVWGLIFWAVVRYRREGRSDPAAVPQHIPVEIAYTLIPLDHRVRHLLLHRRHGERMSTRCRPTPMRSIHVSATAGVGSSPTPTVRTGRPQESSTSTTAEPRKLAPARGLDTKYYPQLVLPANATVRINLTTRATSSTVSTSPRSTSLATRSPGTPTTFDFTTTTAGVFRAQCTQFCGLYHCGHALQRPRSSSSARSSRTG
jgi:cytochrome c oxidase subunit 2